MNDIHDSGVSDYLSYLLSRGLKQRRYKTPLLDFCDYIGLILCVPEQEIFSLASDFSRKIDDIFDEFHY